MKIVIDNCVPRKFALLISGHEVVEARKLGWHELQNGQLIAAAESGGFDVLVTTDKNLQYQQSLGDRRISVIVLAPLMVTYENLVPLLDKLSKTLESLPTSTMVRITPESQK